MAVKRVNIMDAVDSRASQISRSRTAICRRATVTVSRDVNNIARVLLGGAAVDAVCLNSAAALVGDEVLVLCDTDGYWIVAGLSTPKTANGAALFSVNAANATLGAAWGMRAGKLIQLHLTVTVLAAVTSTATGNLTDVALGQVIDPAYRPVWTVAGVASTQQIYGNVMLGADGNAILTHLSAPNLTVAAGTGFTLDFAYMGV